MRAIVGAAMAFGLTVSAGAQAQQQPAMPSWMAGCWEMRATEEGEQRWAEECWTISRGGQMLGSGRAGTGGGVASFEFMKIERGDGGLTFSASPGGNGWTPFASSEDSGQTVTFVNADNDYPQRIRYWREGPLLKARISLLDGSKAEEWTYSPMVGG